MGKASWNPLEARQQVVRWGGALQPPVLLKGDEWSRKELSGGEQESSALQDRPFPQREGHSKQGEVHFQEQS